MTCAEVHDLIRTGAAPSTEALAHAETCEACAVLLDEQALGPALDAWGEDLPLPDAGGVLAAIEADKGPLARLRRLPTPWHAALAVAVVVGVTGGVALFRPRFDLPVYPTDRMALVLGVLAATALAALAVQLRPLHRPPLPRWARVVALAGVVAVPLALAGLPEASSPHGVDLSGMPLWTSALGCFLFGTGSGLGLFVLLRAMDRRTHTPWVLAALAAGLLGLAGNLALQLHCPMTDPVHLLLGHATIGAVWAVVAGGLALARAR